MNDRTGPEWDEIVVRGGREFKRRDCPSFIIGDYWQLNDGSQIPVTIEEKADNLSRVDGIVSLGRDKRQSELRAQAAAEIEDQDLGDTLLAIHPVHINRIMGNVPTFLLRDKEIQKVGYQVALKFLKKLPKHYDLSKEDDRKVHLLILNAEVAEIQTRIEKGIIKIEDFEGVYINPWERKELDDFFSERTRAVKKDGEKKFLN